MSIEFNTMVNLDSHPSEDVAGLVKDLLAQACLGDCAMYHCRLLKRAAAALQSQSSRDLAVAEAVREACAKVCGDIKNGAHKDFLRHLAVNGGKFRYGAGDPANFSSQREADFLLAEERIRALDLPALLAGMKET